MKKIFKVVLAGRMNVGKSTLFNRLAERVTSLVLDYPGLTRDTIHDTIVIDGMACQLVDTAGIGALQMGVLEQQSQEKTYNQLRDADLVLFMVDGALGVMPEERAFAQWLHALGVPVIVVMNKADRTDFLQASYEFEALGFKNMVAISAAHGTGIPELLDSVVSYLKHQGHAGDGELAQEPRCRIMLLGKPNAGKSSLMNAMVGYERAIVSEIAGTTREAVSQRIMYYQEPFDIVDTPGVRKKSSVQGPVEPHMVHATFQALTNCDIAMVVVDATDGELSDQVLKLAFYAFQERYKAVMIVLTKWDLVTPAQVAKIEDSLESYKQLTNKVPVFKVSGLTGKNVGKLVPEIKRLCERYNQSVDGKRLYTAFQVHMGHTPLVRNQIFLSIDKVIVTGTAPLTLTLTVPEPKLWEPSHIAFLEKIARSEYDLWGVPVKFVLVKRG
jgi:GTPase